MRHRFLVIAALAVVSAACSGGGGGSDTVAVVATPAGLADAAAHTAAAKTGHVEMTTESIANGQQGRIVATGAFDSDRHLLSMAIDLSGGSSNTASNDPTAGSPSEIIATGDTVYLHFPAVAKLLGMSTEWISTKADSGASTFDFADPSAFLDFLHGAGEVTSFGREQVRGVDTTHLHATVKLRDALNSTTGDEQQRLQRAIDQLGPSGRSLIDSDLPVDVFIDDAGMVRRIVFDFEVPASGSSGSSSAQFTIDLFDFGSDVAITPPPADQVTDASATLAQLTGVLGGG